MSSADTPDEQPGDEPASYEAAVDELTRIVEQLESGDVDIDALASQVERAGELVTWCRDRVEGARAAVADAAAAIDSARDDRE